MNAPSRRPRPLAQDLEADLRLALQVNERLDRENEMLRKQLKRAHDTLHDLRAKLVEKRIK